VQQTQRQNVLMSKQKKDVDVKVVANWVFIKITGSNCNALGLALKNAQKLTMKNAKLFHTLSIVKEKDVLHLESKVLFVELFSEDGKVQLFARKLFTILVQL
jgi:hypothetical protein